ncbi:MAG: histidinol-phosphate transaminase [Nitrospirota bacterium]|jgi:histidinol-phosphate aminotransferase
MVRPPEYVSAIEPYVPGKPIEELERELGIKGSVKLASNENPAGPSRKAVEALTPEVMGALNRYPDGGAFYLTRALAERHGVSEDQIILGNGSNELIDIAVRTFMRPGDEAVMAWPSFVVYPMSVQAQGCRGVRVPLRDFRHDLAKMAEAVTEKTKMVFVANPNNPTGTINTRDEFDGLMEGMPEGVLVLVDEAYFEYVESADYADAMKHMRSGRNVLALRTFSKIYGLAGLRIGYGVTRPEIARDMNRLREPFNTNSLAQAAALAALSDTGHVERSKRINGEGKAYLYRELDALGIRYVPTEANFIFMFPGKPSAEVYGALLKRGVIVRPMGEDSIRVTIGLPEENKRFIEGMKAVLI